jgi:putative transcriptional regulator
MKNLDQFLNRIDLPIGTPSSGALLVAEPFLRESYFNHAVIYLVDYGRDITTMGIVMNKATGYTLSDILKSVTRKEPIPVYCGGPLSGDRLYFIHRLGDIIPGSKHIADGLYIGGNFDSMIEYINAGYPVDGLVRFYLGYSGWDAGQLDDELSKHVWAVTSPKNIDNILKGSEDGYWHGQVRSLGSSYRGWLYHPQYPSLN